MRLLYKKTVTLSWRHTGERFLFVRRWRHAALARFPGRWPSGGVYPRPWLRVILRLSPHCQRSALRERRKILIDLPGFGYSDKPRVFSYNIHEQALVLEQFLSHLRLQRFALFGHSMGGSIAIEAAGLLGERVTTLLVSNPTRSPAAASTAGALRRSQSQPLSLTAMPGCWRRSARRGRVVYKTAPPGPSGGPPAA